MNIINRLNNRIVDRSITLTLTPYFISALFIFSFYLRLFYLLPVRQIKKRIKIRAVFFFFKKLLRKKKILALRAQIINKKKNKKYEGLIGCKGSPFLYFFFLFFSYLQFAFFIYCLTLRGKAIINKKKNTIKRKVD